MSEEASEMQQERSDVPEDVSAQPQQSNQHAGQEVPASEQGAAHQR